MISSLYVKDFTFFPETDFDFGKLNVFTGEAGIGRSHIMQALYSMLSASFRSHHRLCQHNKSFDDLQAGKLRQIFGVDIPELCRETPAQLCVAFQDNKLDLGLSLTKNGVEVIMYPLKWLPETPVFLPNDDVLKLYEPVCRMQDEGVFGVELLRDLAGLIALRSAPVDSDLLLALNNELGGSVLQESDFAFFFVPFAGEKKELRVVAESLRRLLILPLLVSRKILRPGSYLFWELPETGLDSKAIRIAARLIGHLASAGIQVFITTNSLFLLRELTINKSTLFNNLDTQYFGFKFVDGTQVTQGGSMDDLDGIPMVDEELLQSDRYLNLDILSSHGYSHR